MNFISCLSSRIHEYQDFSSSYIYVHVYVYVYVYVYMYACWYMWVCGQEGLKKTVANWI